MQAHFSQLELPISDYVTDLKSVLDQSIRIIQAMIDICANSGWLASSMTCMHLLQMVMQVHNLVEAFGMDLLVLMNPTNENLLNSESPCVEFHSFCLHLKNCFSPHVYVTVSLIPFVALVPSTVLILLLTCNFACYFSLTLLSIYPTIYLSKKK